MGKKDKKKKKGVGAEKTASKTEKKLLAKQKKLLEKVGEEDIEKLVLRFDKKDEKPVSEIVVCQPPSARVNFSICQNPEKDEIFLFGGEFFNGKRTEVYGDFFVYSTSKNEWKSIKSSVCPAPRSGHQMVYVPTDGGQLFLYGGEYASPSGLQFYHFKDLWKYQIKTKTWEKINAPNPPTPRSGHRMIFSKKKLFVFGGFYDNNMTFNYHNDIHYFSLETFTWTQIKPASPTLPEPRSGCIMSASKDGKIFVYGGYTKQRKNKEIEHGKTHTDCFYLVHDEKSDTWKWNQIKAGGSKPHPRSGIAYSTSANDRVYIFGGVMDTEEDDENLRGLFGNEIHYFDMNGNVWRKVEVGSAKSSKAEEKSSVEEETPTKSETVVTDNVFQLTVGSSQANTSKSTASKTPQLDIGSPSPRMNSGIVIVKNVLYVFAGMYEMGHRQYTLNDFYSLDLHKLDSWKTLIQNMPSLQWFGSDSEGSSSSEMNTDDDNDSEESDSDSDMDTE